jgi:hypothetical protein
MRCQECGVEADARARGWRALIAHAPWDDELPETAVYCPVCAWLEFGPPERSSTPRR